MAKEKQPDPIDVFEEFVAHAIGLEHEVYIGIDPGVTGAIGLLCGKVARAVDIPVARSAVKRAKKLSEEEQKRTGRKTKLVKGSIGEFDYTAICELFRILRPLKERAVVALEKIPPKAGPGPLRMADVKIYAAWAMWPLYLAGRGYALEEPRPNEWKTAMRLGAGDKSKEISRLRSLKLWPKHPDLLRKKDHNRAEALLMAYFIRSQREHK